MPCRFAGAVAGKRDEFRLEGLDLARPSRFRVVLGPQNTRFSEQSIKAFLDGEYTVSPATDRMAMQLDGPKLEHIAGHDIVSDGIALGSIQVPGHGRPIVLMVDRQTTGGYPKVATVISADLPALGRSRIGDKISFQEASVEEAQQLRRTLLQQIDAIPNRIVPAHRTRDDLTACLLTQQSHQRHRQCAIGSVHRVTGDHDDRPFRSNVFARAQSISRPRTRRPRTCPAALFV